jgi:asparaginyl-tRNA synthetase
VSADGDLVERLVWKEPAKSAVKKAQGALDANKKKVLKQQQVASQEEKEKARLKHLEEAKKIVLTEEPSLPTAVKITIGDKDVQLGEGTVKGTRAKLSWRVHRLRQQKQATFLTLVDGYGHL